RGDLEAAATRQSVPGVEYEVDHDELQLCGVDEHSRAGITRGAHKLDVVADDRREHRLDFCEKLVQVDGLRLERLGPPEVEELLDDPSRVVGGVLDRHELGRASKSLPQEPRM